jgi:hypothetical protein
MQMISKRWMVLGVALVAGVAVLPVYAGGASAGFKALDANQDGAISQQEAQAHKGLSENYIELDKNQDGTLDVVEFSAFEAAGRPEAPTAPNPMK